MHEPSESAHAADHSLILASRVTGTPVYSRSGERIGHVDDLSIEKQGGRVIYAIMSFGGFLGIGEKFHPIPWSMLEYDPDRGGYGGYVVPLDRSELEGAPFYAREDLVALGGASHQYHGERIFEYYGPYGPMPYW